MELRSLGLVVGTFLPAELSANPDVNIFLKLLLNFFENLSLAFFFPIERLLQLIFSIYCGHFGQAMC